jgi:hypothetical protein
MPKIHPTALATALLAALGAPALGAPALARQDPAETEDAASAEGVISYTPADFAAARPDTALDMLNRLPGFSVDGGNQVRGFAGAAGNVLIDGGRPTIKSDSLFEMLARIPINQVERIDVIRGGAPGIDMQGRTVVANVIRTRVDTFQQVISAQGIVFTETGHFMPGWNYEATRRAGERQFDFQLSRGLQYDDSVGSATRTTLDAATGDVLFEDAFTEADGSVHSARANYKGPLAGGVLSANSLFSTDEWKDEVSFFSATTDERFVGRSSNDRGEIGLNFTRPLGARFELETLALSKLAVGEGRNTGLAGGSASLFEVEVETGESIGRSVLRFTQSPTLSFEGGGEVAFNYREQQIGLTVDSSRISLPASDVRVEELRGEVFAQGAWRPRPQYNFEAGVRVEESTITQTGDTTLERSFLYPKPRLVGTWSPTERDQVRVRIEREVGQLNFGDFTSNVNLSTSVLSAGNALLEPNKTWVYEIAFEKHFWGSGAAVLTLRHQDVTDVVDDFPFFVFVDADGDGAPDDGDLDGLPDQQLVSGRGNIGDGTIDFADLSLTLPLARLGLQGGEIKIAAMVQEGEVRDPLTGEMRAISGQRPNRLSVNFRQDLPAQRLTFGVFWFAGWSERRFRLQEIQALDLRNYWETFVEYKPTPRLTLEAALNNVSPYSFTIERRVFDGPRDTGSLAVVQTEERNSQVIASLRARLSFD